MKQKLPFPAVTAMLAIALNFIAPASAPACSTFKLQKGSELLYGHNLNANGLDIPGLAFINKRGIFKTGRTWSELFNRDRRNPSALAWIARYGSVTFNTFGKDFPDGGMNEAGLYVWEMGLGGSEVVYPRNSALPKLNQMHWMQYVLDNFATVDEAVQCACEIEIDGWGWHFFVGDGAGHCAAVDFVDNKVVVHQNEAMPVPGLFNTLYEREIGISRYFKGFGGLYEPRLDDPRVPRLVKTALLLDGYDPRQDAVEYGFHILDSIFVNEVADWSVLFDVRRRIVHFKTGLNREIKRFAIDDFDFSNAGPTMILDIDMAEAGDVGKRFQPFSFEAMAGFIKKLPLPAGFYEGGGLKAAELIDRLATHTAFARAAANQPFAGYWQAKPEKPGEKPRWEIHLFGKDDAVLGAITNARGFAAGAPLEHIHMAGNRLTFTFRSKKAGDIMEVRALIDSAKMSMELWGIQDPYGSFELVRQPANMP